MKRFIIFIVGLCLGWCAMWLGGAVHVYASANMKGPVLWVLMTLLVLFGVVMAAVGVFAFLWIAFAYEDARKTMFVTYDVVDVAIASASGICFGFLFGAIVAPIGNSAGIAVWNNWWNFLLILGLTPIGFTAKVKRFFGW